MPLGDVRSSARSRFNEHRRQPRLTVPAGTEVVSFDVFDTALVRLVTRPSQVFALVAARQTAVSGCPAGYDFVSERIDAERQSRVVGEIHSDSEDVTLDEIYARLALPMGWDRTILQRLEIETEVAVARSNPKVLEFYREVTARGLPVVFVSDMYLPGEAIGRMLTAAGYDQRAGLFVSCEVGKLKASARLFADVARNLGVSPSRIFHVGDNHHSDVRMARSAGLRAQHLPAAYEQASGSVLSLGTDVTRALARRRGETHDGVDSFWTKFGYEAAGPLLVGFVGWVIAQARAEECEHVFFLARDGWILQKVYKLLRGEIPDSYVYASRRALRVPAVGTRTEIDVEMLLDVASAPLSVGHYLRRIGIDPVENASAIRAVGFSGPDAKVSTSAHREQILGLLRGVSEQIRAQAEEEREALLAYFRQTGLLDERRAAVVDVGWLGSLQDAMVTLISEATGSTPPIVGLYMGTLEGAARVAAKGLDLKAFLCNFGSPAGRAQEVSACIDIWEFIYRAPHGTLVRFVLTPEGDAEPVLAPSDLDETELEILSEIHRGVCEFAADWSRVSADLGGLMLTADESAAAMARVVIAPTRREAGLLGDLTVVRGMGEAEVYERFAPALSLSRALSKPGSMFTGYEHALWRRGFSRRLFPGPCWSAGYFALEMTRRAVARISGLRE